VRACIDAEEEDASPCSETLQAAPGGRLGESCGSGDSQVGSMGIRAIPSQAMGAPAFSAA